MRGAPPDPGPDDPDPLEPDVPDPLEPDEPDPLEPDVPDPLEPDEPDPLEPDVPDPLEPDVPDPPCEAPAGSDPLIISILMIRQVTLWRAVQLIPGPRGGARTSGPLGFGFGHQSTGRLM